MSGFVETTNPATGERVAKYPVLSLDATTRKLKRAHHAYEEWRGVSLGERIERLRNLAEEIRSRKPDCAELITTEMGKPITQSLAEVEKSAWTAEVYSENAEGWLEEELGHTDAQLSYVAFQPLGVVLSTMPWNFPFLQSLRSAIPNLVAGNTVVLRLSNVCAGMSLALEHLFKEAGFPEDVFSSVVTDHETLAGVIGSDYVQGVAFTGSVEAGQRIAALAGKNLKKCVLELGGSDPFIVLADANLKEASRIGANARMLYAGQNCIAAKRFIVESSVASEFSQLFVEECGRKKMGDPMDPLTEVGPLISAQQVKIIDRQVRDAVSKGAVVSIGGRPGKGRGWFYHPTVLERVTRKMRVMREEVFGPVAPILIVQGEDEAMQAANDSEFGLGASLWTSDSGHARELASQIESGMVFVNGLVKTDPRMPFGGVKKSGIGRELSKYGLREFVNVKSVNIFGAN